MEQNFKAIELTALSRFDYEIVIWFNWDYVDGGFHNTKMHLN